jgi:D-sedoheptulose 7-phosphate isomerase
MYLSEVVEIARHIGKEEIESIINYLIQTKEKNGRLFILGVGGGAGNASHAVNDFRKIAGIESYAPTDNISEITARVNDNGWDTVFVDWLKGSRLNANDCVFVFSVGGGNAEKNISANIVHALKYAKETGSKIIGIVGRDGGFTAKVADACVIVPTFNNDTVTPHTEAFQGVVWHLVISHPALKKYEMKWESTK